MTALIFLYYLLPLGTAVQFGGDEGYQLITGFLMSKGYALYTPIWNDQPPVHVLLLKWLFQHWGPSILAARLMAAGFGLVLFGTFFQLVRQRLAGRTALLATLFLVSGPAIFELSVSAMQEVPAFALALVSVWLLFQWSHKRRWGWLLVSGAVMGVALGIKLTAVLVVPAMLVEVWLAFNRPRAPVLMKPAALAILTWIITTGLIFAGITLLWGQGSFQTSFRSHFAEHAITGLARPEDFPLPFSLFWDHAECTGAAIVGLILVSRRRQWRPFALPLVMLATVMFIHLFHRPWWGYYYLHLAIPLAWLAGFAVNEALTHVSRLLARSQLDFASSKTWQGVGLCALVALVLVRAEGRLESGVKNLRERERVETSPILAKMKENAGRTHWVYVQYPHEIYPFQAQLLMPPELALVTLKRFWSDQISEAQIIEICRHYQPEQVLLKAEPLSDAWQAFLSPYTIVYQDKDFVLYVLK